jgi:hypothetical protein
LKEAAKREGKPQALEEYLGRREYPALRSLGMGADEELSARDSED